MLPYNLDKIHVVQNIDLYPSSNWFEVPFGKPLIIVMIFKKTE